MNRAQAPHWLPDPFVPFVFLSYPVEPPANPDSFHSSNYYATGLLDGCLVISCIAIMAIWRDVARIFVMEPFAKWYLTPKSRNKCEESNGVISNGNGHRDLSEKRLKVSVKGSTQSRIIHRSVLRFGEQGWSLIYYTLQWCFGLYIHSNLPTAPFNPSMLWEGYPHVPLAGPVKLYYLTQSAFYLHQILILNAEARRKDHVQMMSHHIITVALMGISYYSNFTRVGCLIMVLMDFCDIFLPLAKMLRYLSFPVLCDVTFGVFLLSWLISRHVLFVLVIISCAKHVQPLSELTWIPDRKLSTKVTLARALVGMLAALQVLQAMWFFLICNIAWRVINGQGADDTRSDDEGDESPQGDSSDIAPDSPGLKRRSKKIPI